MVKEKEAERQATQTELDDLLIVFTDLEEKVARYKVSAAHGDPVGFANVSQPQQAGLKELGEAISDGEEGEEDEDEDEDDEDVD